MTQIPTTSYKSSVGSPNHEYESMVRIWRRARAILNGELYAKEHDRQLDIMGYTNLLVPFSPRMSPEQYRWYVAEAELPGLSAQYAKVIAGGLLRKEPQLVLPDFAEKDEALDWLRNRFTEDGRPLVAFLDEAIWEELSTSRGWVSVDYPAVENFDSLSKEQKDNLAPYPIIWKAEDVINWQIGVNSNTNRPALTRVVFRYIDQDFSESDYHPTLKIIAADHYLDEAGVYRVQKYKRKGEAIISVTNGDLKMSQLFSSTFFTEGEWEPEGELMTPLLGGEPLTALPIFPLNSQLSVSTPMLTPIIDREIALYNKVSRRNHLLYGAATYTPVIFSENLSEEDFLKIVNSGLGSWIKLGANDKVDAFKTPTDALADMDRAIEASVSEMARMGIRMLAPESADSSGVALEIRNSSLTAQLGVLNSKISTVMQEVVKLMLRWKYGKDLDMTGLEFKLSADFNPAPLGSEWARLATEWYQARLIPRSVWLSIAKHHDIIPSDYDDEEGQTEIGQDTLVQPQFDLQEDAGVQQWQQG
jgi:hypothetical protein